MCGRGLNDEDAVRLAGELPVAELKLRAQQYLDDCEFHLAVRLPIALLTYALVFLPFWLSILIAGRYYLHSGSRHAAGS